jgi:molybdopterin converting factor small subunit
MQVHVLLFGQLAENAVPEIVLNNLPDTDSLVEAMNKQFPSLRDMQYRIAVNRKLVEGNTVLENNVVVALLPSFSGG